MSHVRVTASIVNDSTGIKTHIPVILLEEAGHCTALMPLVDYLLVHSQARSPSWMSKMCQIVGMLLDYMEANHANFEKPAALFKTFTQRVYTGTIGEDGKDASDLYWFPKRTASGKPLLNMLSEFSDWMHREYGTTPLNPWREATACEQRLNWAAFINKSERSFLGHLDSYADAAQTAKQARDTLQRKTPQGQHGGTKAFPDDRFMDLLFIGFVVPGKQNSLDIVEQYDWRGICITILMHWGGLRVSEPFHLWVNDVVPFPLRPDEASVRVYHPIEGAAPRDFKGPSGRFMANREAYLQARYPGYPPRNRAKGNRKAGWKNPKLDDNSQNFMYVHWFPAGIAGRLFLQAWKLYMYQRMRARIGADKHPWLFVSFREGQKGEPYTIDSYQEAHARAIRRIGLEPAKQNGTTDHGHRHAYGQRTRRAAVGSIVTQQGLHQKSIESQAVYIEPSIAEVTTALEIATEALETGQYLPMLDDLDALILAARKGQKNQPKEKRR
ncbi:site-specific integrase [Herbaspirillum lusitanum]|uniref:gamma-mobile-trio recombinase GmtY n=1 Tax=Herbaspirillum lusitanum TaxID=213312 RepID=UPI002237B5D4|nr:gamma-mobile-trio recombinase GmtY [Herbaspirillum lusitanum]MCW5300341.1 site-specific integrase [Herbaspirillum lusitanum]